MKVSKKREIHQIAVDHSPNIDFNDFMKLCRKCSAKQNKKKKKKKKIQSSILLFHQVIYTFSKKPVGRSIALLSGKIDKYEYLMDEEILLNTT